MAQPHIYKDTDQSRPNITNLPQMVVLFCGVFNHRSADVYR
jgi:hypothetical protein